METRRQREGQSKTRALLLQLLEGACGSREAAVSTLRLALVRSGLDGVPDTPDKALLFVRAHLLGKLTEEVGPRLAMALVDDLVERLDEPPQSGMVPVRSPSSAQRIARLSVRSSPVARGTLLLVDRDAFRRASVARPLVPAGWNVRTAHDQEEVLDAAGGYDTPTAIVVAVEHPSVEAIVRAAVANWPEAAVIVHGDPAVGSGRLLEFLLELRQVRVCSRDEPLLDRIDALVDEVRRK
ncbi:MAG: hypothetical protein ACRENE_06730 [Polyangiaceae bacterium]